MTKRERIETEIERRIKEEVIFQGEEQGWDHAWPIDWRLDSAQIIVEEALNLKIAAKYNSHLTRKIANEMITRYYRAARLAAAFEAALKRAA